MSQIDTEENVLLQTKAEQDDNMKLVPVSESIRYRKRAQSAEKLNENLTEQLGQARNDNQQMAEQLEQVKLERDLMQKLATAGAVDVETAMLLAKARLTDGDDTADLDGCIEQLKKDKQYLFGGYQSESMAKKTAGAKERVNGGKMVLERAAQKAAETGSRVDLQEYLKLRRNFV
ncbi:MAG: hypothetical protein ACYSSI_01995 [Planctomycetota bacterium]|jgi:thioredoxin-like negative regulator of GroEL